MDNQTNNEIQEQYNKIRKERIKLELELYHLDNRLEDIQTYNKKHWFNTLLLNICTEKNILRNLCILVALIITSSAIIGTIIPTNSIIHFFTTALIGYTIGFTGSKAILHFTEKAKEQNNTIKSVNEQKHTITQKLQKAKNKETILFALYTEQQNRSQERSSHIKPISHDYNDNNPKSRTKK